MNVPAAETVQHQWLVNTSPGLERFWHPVAFGHEISASAPTRVELLGRRWVVLRRSDGTLAAFGDECPHRRASLGTGCVVDGTLQCPYHGWRFDLDGHCVAIPSLAQTATIPSRAQLAPPWGVREHLGLVWIAVAEPMDEPIPWPQWAIEGWDAWYLDRRSTAASAGLLTENFLDATHFAVVHRNTFGSNSPSQGMDSSERSNWRIAGGFAQLTYQPGLGNVTARVTVSLQGPFSVHILIASSAGSRAFTFFMQPCSDQETRLFLGVACDDTKGDVERIRAETVFNNTVYDEDLAVLEEFADMRLPLDLRAEVHTQVDAHLVKYRRLLSDIVATRNPLTAVSGEADTGAER